MSVHYAERVHASKGRRVAAEVHSIVLNWCGYTKQVKPGEAPEAFKRIADEFEFVLGVENVETMLYSQATCPNTGACAWKSTQVRQNTSWYAMHRGAMHRERKLYDVEPFGVEEQEMFQMKEIHSDEQNFRNIFKGLNSGVCQHA